MASLRAEQAKMLQLNEQQLLQRFQISQEELRDSVQRDYNRDMGLREHYLQQKIENKKMELDHQGLFQKQEEQYYEGDMHKFVREQDQIYKERLKQQKNTFKEETKQRLEEYRNQCS